MLRGLLGRWRARRADEIAEDYGNMSAGERREVERLRSLARTHRTEGEYVGGGRTFDQELDAEEGRPRR